MTTCEPRTELQCRVAELLRTGLLHKQIAAQLGCSTSTVDHVAAQFGIHPKRERVAAARAAITAGEPSTDIARRLGLTRSAVAQLKRQITKQAEVPA